MRKTFAVVGSPIDHSLSPQLHQAVFDHFGLEYLYLRRKVELGQLSSVVDEFNGMSVTMPLKEEAFAIASRHDAFAEATRVANTLVRRDGDIYGANTDVSGLRSLFRSYGLSTVKKAIVIGSGATARSAIVALDGVAQSVEVVARNQSALLPNNPVMTPWNSPLDGDLVISTVPSGVADHFAPGRGILLDVVYAPWPTPIAAAWPGEVISGLEMLIHQAALQSKLFLEALDVDFEAILQVMRRALET